MYIFYECNVCGHKRNQKIEICTACGIGDMVPMTVIRKDVLDKLKLEFKYYKEKYEEYSKALQTIAQEST